MMYFPSKIGLVIFICLICYSSIFGQGNYMRENEYQDYILQRQEIELGKFEDYHTSIKPQTQSELHDLAILKENYDTSGHMNYLLDQNKLYLFPEKKLESSKRHKLLSHFFNPSAHLFSYQNENLYFTIDPVLELKTGLFNNNNWSLQNKRGVRITAGIDRRVYIESDILETQSIVPDYVKEYVEQYHSFPGAGFLKFYNSQFIKNSSGYDYLLSNAAIHFNISKHIYAHFGHGNNFIGFGHRSMLLSDFSAPYFYVKLNTKIWRLHYQNLFAELSAQSKYPTEADHLLTKKFMAAHLLSINITNKWNLGFFESVIFSRNKQYELQYLNPIILYRTVEQAVGSPDNVFLGFQTELLPVKNVGIYAQLLLDEFVLKEIVHSKNGWWGNKYCAQLGIKYSNAFGIKKLDMQLEYNMARPYAYAYKDSITNYTHFQQALAHPLGANFAENIISVNYNPIPKLFLQAKCMIYQKGLDSSNTNFGGNILKSYYTRNQDYNNSLLQGVKQKVNLVTFESAYSLFPNLYWDIDVILRNEKSINKNSKLVWIQTGIRWNINRKRYLF